VASFETEGVGLAKGVVRSDSPIPLEKRDLIERSEKLRADALASPIPGPFAKGGPPVKAATPEPWPEGIFETGQAPFPSSLYHQWQANLREAHVQVYAGSEADDASQGVVVVRVTSLDLKTFTSDAYRTPIKAGSVRIVGAEGERLTLAATGGTKFLFDVALRHFLSPDTLLPLATPAAGSGGVATSSLPSIATVAIDMDVANTPANTRSSLGSREACRTLSTNWLFKGTSTGSNDVNSLNDASQAFPVPDGLANKAVRITDGAGAGQVRRIMANTATQLTVSPDWVTIPDATSKYRVLPALYVDVTVDAVPPYDSGMGSGGLSGLGFNLSFDPAVVSVIGVNPGGDSDILLAAGGYRNAFGVIDADAVAGPPADDLPATTGNLRVDLGDLTHNVESGAGVLARLLLVGVASGRSDLTLASVDIFDGSAETANYAVGNVVNARVAVNVSCQ
jgi:hypothetical protein